MPCARSTARKPSIGNVECPTVYTVVLAAVTAL
jgi:hypothetical protein